MKIYFTLLITLTVLTGCTTYSTNDKKQFDQEIKSYLKKKGVSNCKTSLSGLHFRIDSIGTGRFIQFQDSVSISYSGSLLSGIKVDVQKAPITFAVRDLIPAWKELLLELKKGASAYMVVPPHLGYGSNKLDKIPPHSILEFTLKVHDVK